MAAQKDEPTDTSGREFTEPSNKGEDRRTKNLEQKAAKVTKTRQANSAILRYLRCLLFKHRFSAFLLGQPSRNSAKTFSTYGKVAGARALLEAAAGPPCAERGGKSPAVSTGPFHAMISRIGWPNSISSRLWPGTSSLCGERPISVSKRRVDVGHVVRMLDGMEADFVGRAVNDAPLEAAAGHPDRKAVRMMIAAVVALRARRAAEFGGEDDDRLVQQAAALEIGQAGRPRDGRPVWRGSCDCSRARCARPTHRPRPSPCMICTNRTPCSTSRRAARELHAERARHLIVEAVKGLRLPRFAR